MWAATFGDVVIVLSLWKVACLLKDLRRPDGDTYYNASTLSFDQQTGAMTSTSRYEDKSAGAKLVGMNYDIHVGSIAGLPGKIIAFLASLICGSLPIAGFIIWVDRKKRKKTVTTAS